MNHQSFLANSWTAQLDDCVIVGEPSVPFHIQSLPAAERVVPSPEPAQPSKEAELKNECKVAGETSESLHAQSLPAAERAARKPAPVRLTKDTDLIKGLCCLQEYAASMLNRFVTPHDMFAASPKDSGPLDRFAEYYQGQVALLTEMLHQRGYTDEQIAEAKSAVWSAQRDDLPMREEILSKYRRDTGE